MYICPTCNKKFKAESEISKHFLMCWKELHPYHQSKSAPHSADVEVRNINPEILDFFSKLQEK